MGSEAHNTLHIKRLIVTQFNMAKILRTSGHPSWRAA